MKRVVVATIATVAALTVATACSSSSNKGSTSGGTSTSASSSGTSGKTSSTPLRILILAATSVPAEAAAQGENVVAAKTAIAQVNAAGGVLGHPVELQVADEGGNPTTAVTKLNSALSGGSKPVAVLQTDVSTIASAILPLTTQNKLVSMNSATTGDSGDVSKYPYNFDLDPSNASLAAAFCPQMKAAGAKTFALLHQDDQYADSETDAVTKACQADGLTSVGNEKYNPTALSMTPQIAALQAKKPDVVMLSTYGAPAGYVLQDVSKVGWNVPILGDAAVMSSPPVTTTPPSGMLGTSLEANLKCLVYASTAYSANEPAPVKTLIAGMKKNGGIASTLINTYAYDEVLMLSAAATAAGTTTDGAAITKALENQPAGTVKTAVFPSYSFSATNHSNDAPPSAFAFVKPTKLIDGQFGNPAAS
ncbi:ABC transporter substrate-binding protein [Jatrophihabitans sp.]|uniref:ABC transporter substrate-binding protein n=1 Tax=Jatrophihabitans sp. TaxID=1932789 RepID=UPI0030C7758A|nr:amino acid transporter, substrate-binding component [Jatrophihabitans sp.]